MYAAWLVSVMKTSIGKCVVPSWLIMGYIHLVNRLFQYQVNHWPPFCHSEMYIISARQTRAYAAPSLLTMARRSRFSTIKRS